MSTSKQTKQMPKRKKQPTGSASISKNVLATLEELISKNVVKSLKDRVTEPAKRLKASYDRKGLAMFSNRGTPRPGYTKLGPESKSSSSAPPPYPPRKPSGFMNTGSQHPAEFVQHHTAPIRSVGVAATTEVPEVGWSMRMANSPHDTKDCIEFEGTDYLSSIPFASLATAGTSIARVFLNPKTLNLPRLNAFAPLFERFVFDHFEIIYCQATSSSTTGGMVMYYDRDPSDTLANGANARIRAAFGHTGVVTTNFWEGSKIVLPPNPGNYFVDSGTDGRLVYQGIFNALTEIGSNATANPGLFMVRYRVRLWQSKIDGDTGAAQQFVARSSSGSTAANPFGTGVLTPGTQSAGSVIYNSNSIFTLDSNIAAYSVNISVTGTVITAIAFAPGINLVSAGVFPAGVVLNCINSAQTLAVMQDNFVVVNPAAATSLGITLTATTVTNATIVVTPIAYTNLTSQTMRLKDELKLAESRIFSISTRLNSLESSKLEVETEGGDLDDHCFDLVPSPTASLKSLSLSRRPPLQEERKSVMRKG
jgi:hypothetical protein